MYVPPQYASSLTTFSLHSVHAFRSHDTLRVLTLTQHPQHLRLVLPPPSRALHAIDLAPRLYLATSCRNLSGSISPPHAVTPLEQLLILQLSTYSFLSALMLLAVILCGNESPRHVHATVAALAVVDPPLWLGMLWVIGSGTLGRASMQ